MKKESLFLGLDLGTSGLKVGVFDNRGNRLASANALYETRTPEPGWQEQRPNEWWAACTTATSDVLDKVEASCIRAICVVGQSPALVCVDKDGEPVRPALIWSDQRAAKEGLEVAQRLGPFSHFSLLPRLLWLKRYEPISYHQTHWIFESFEYISFRLTGKIASVATSAHVWSDRHISALGLEPEKLPSHRFRFGEVYGPVLSTLAGRWGLPTGLPVIAGTIDAFAAWIGTATVSKGQLCNTAGTSEGIAVVWDKPLSDVQMRAVSVPHVTGTDWIVGGAMSTGGIMLDWFAKQFYPQADNPYLEIVNDAEKIPAGAEGLIALPYLVGERSPIMDPQARGLFFGISEIHTRAHFARALLESIAFAVRDVFEVIKEMGAETTEIRVGGGGARLDTLNQIKADVLGQPVLIPEVTESSELGAAIIAGWGAGFFTDLSTAAESMVKFRATFQPDARRHAIYNELLALYRRLYDHLKSDFATLSRLNKELLQSTDPE